MNLFPLALAALLGLFAGEARAAQGPEDFDSQFLFVVQVVTAEKFSCSGVVLFPQIVLTAGHCLTASGNVRNAKLANSAVIFVEDENGRARSVRASHLLLPASFGRYKDPYSERLFDVGLLLFDLELPLKPARSIIEGMDFSGIAADYEASGVISPKNGQAYIRRLGEIGLDEASATGVGVGQSECVQALVALSCKNVDGKRRIVGMKTYEGVDCFNKRAAASGAQWARVTGSPLFKLSFWCLSSTSGEERFLHGDSGAPVLMRDRGGDFRVVGIQSAFAGIEKAGLALDIAPSLMPALELLGKAAKLGYMTAPDPAR